MGEIDHDDADFVREQVGDECCPGCRESRGPDRGQASDDEAEHDELSVVLDALQDPEEQVAGPAQENAADKHELGPD